MPALRAASQTARVFQMSTHQPRPRAVLAHVKLAIFGVRPRCLVESTAPKSRIRMECHRGLATAAARIGTDGTGRAKLVYSTVWLFRSQAVRFLTKVRPVKAASASVTTDGRPEQEAADSTAVRSPTQSKPYPILFVLAPKTLDGIPSPRHV